MYSKRKSNLHKCLKGNFKAKVVGGGETPFSLICPKLANKFGFLFLFFFFKKCPVRGSKLEAADTQLGGSFKNHPFILYSK